MQNNGPSVAFALVGGLVLSMGNLATQYAWPFVGLSITEVVSSSITVVAGMAHAVLMIPVQFNVPLFQVHVCFELDCSNFPKWVFQVVRNSVNEEQIWVRRYNNELLSG